MILSEFFGKKKGIGKVVCKFMYMMKGWFGGSVVWVLDFGLELVLVWSWCRGWGCVWIAMNALLSCIVLVPTYIHFSE